MSNSCPKPETCLFRGCQDECAQARPAAAACGTHLSYVGNPVRRSYSEAPFKARNAFTHRRLLVAVK